MLTPVIRRAPAVRCFNTSAPICNSGTSRLTIGIRREDPARIWERRCPLTPDAAEELVRKEGVRVLIQDCARRVWGADEFVRAGAEPHPTLSPAHIVLGIKETPLNELITSPLPSPSGTPNHVPRTHLMFSHTHKGQPYNMPLLARFLEDERDPNLAPRLVDYELLTDEQGKRTVGFGWFAGVAGSLESLATLAHFHLEMGVASPFLYTPRPHTHPSIPSLRNSLHGIGTLISEKGTPKELGPMIIGVTGAGKVADGMLDILQELPVVKVNVEDLERLVSNPDTDLHKVYVVHARPQDYFFKADGATWNREDYYQNPILYHSEFHARVLPYLTLLLHGAGWAEGFPRLVTNDQLGVALEKALEIEARGGGKGRGRCVGDVSCDVGGGLEFLPRHSTLSSPDFSTRPEGLPAHLGDVRMMAVDILPSSLPLDASIHFSGVLGKYLGALIGETKGREPKDEEEAALRRALGRATVARGGRLEEGHRWLEKPLSAWKAGQTSADLNSSSPLKLNPNEMGAMKNGNTGLRPERKKRVLLLGSGMVAGPTVEEIAKRGDVELVVASNILADAERLAKPYSNARALLLDVEDRNALGQLIEETDVVISLLPVPLHPSIGELCVKHKTHMVTASYISPAMRDLHQRAISSDILLLNEIGLDPGIDHCSALSLLSRISRQSHQAESFISFCGGLPAPEVAEKEESGPLGYKFSWSPLGMLRAANNGATFKLLGKKHEIPGSELLAQRFPDVPLSKALRLEGYANRDSLPYADTYGLGGASSMRTVLRGTLRYPGFCSLMHAFKGLRLLDQEMVTLNSWDMLVKETLATHSNVHIKNDSGSIQDAIRGAMAGSLSSDVAQAIEALEWLGLIPSLGENDARRTIMPPLPKKPMPAIEAFATVLAHKLRYQPGERDLVVLHHEIVSRPQSILHEAEKHIWRSTLITYGTEKHSAMALTVGLPVAFAALRVLDGKVKIRGVHGPEEEGVWRGVLSGMESVGLGMKESWRIEEPKDVGNRGRIEGVLAAGLAQPRGVHSS